ncbi:prepilin peptidase [Candidatus Accumulibacter phosphatis]|uniref:Prepilin leader peptidase/N-methyltransferase n=1 Tax=Candidatus Accumulibacter phosphatis TaxID=327160 RepID=A0ABX1TV62_9PROT|nr:A24 family peptidase [Candidatus Accumulibacter phosphatis]NMQ28095.1 prepilin peptidase [Candidatus Accumulibacter phosphatis]
MPPALFALICGVLGLLVGSFLNVVIHRLPTMMEREWRNHCAELCGDEAPQHEPLSLARPGSRCPACGHAITALENIPLLSWLFLRGRCSACAAPISLRYPLVEAISGLLCAFAAFHFGYGWTSLAAMLLIWGLIALTCIDFDSQLLPDAITLPLLWAGLLVNLFGTFADLQAAVIGAMCGYLALWSVYWAFKLTTGKEGMGYGDFKLLAALGAWLGWEMLPLTILLSSLLGAVVGIALIVIAKRGRSVPIPFGPYLAMAGLLALFWGKPLTRAYLSLL